MAVHNLGYRRWEGKLAPDWTRWLVITSTGVRRAWQSRWLRRLLLLAWLPAIWFGAGFFVWEQSLLDSGWRQGLEEVFLQGAPQTGTLGDLVRGYARDDPTASRHAVWTWLLQSFFRYPQAVIMVMVIGLIAPALISQDVRSRAFLLYFSRPITRVEYVLGKLGTIWVYLAMISTLPALCLYLVGVLLSPQLVVVQATWDIPLRILVASAVLMVPTASLALCLSSMTQESRYAGFAWFTIWILGWFTYGVMTSVDTMGQRGPLHGEFDTWSHLSPYHTLGQVQRWVFGFAEFREIWTSVLVLVAVTIISTMILFRRVSAPMRV